MLIGFALPLPKAHSFSGELKIVKHKSGESKRKKF
jgi:hypothetical protein